MSLKNKKSDILIKLLILGILIYILIATVQPEVLNPIKKAYQKIESFFTTSEPETEEQENVNIETSISNKIEIDNAKLNIIYFDVGQADCTLILYKEHTILIDAGNKEDGEKIVNGLKSLNIDKIDYVFGTHAHEDHIGGMSYIIDSFEIGKFYLPIDSTNSNAYYLRLLKSLENKGITVSKAGVGDVINIEDVSCEVMCANNLDPENINLSSIVLELAFKEQKFLFMADAEYENEMSRNWEDIDVLKVGHHGSNTSSSKEFLEQTLPEVAIISVGKNNDYEFPKQRIIDRLEENAIIYRTDKDGTIQIISDGTEYQIIKIDIDFDGNYMERINNE